MRISGYMRAYYLYLEPGRSDFDATGFRARGRLNFDFRQPTEYGLLAFYSLRGHPQHGRLPRQRPVGLRDRPRSSGAGGASSVDIPLGYVQFGGFTAGRVQSFFDFWANDDIYTTLLGVSDLNPDLRLHGDVRLGLVGDDRDRRSETSASRWLPRLTLRASAPTSSAPPFVPVDALDPTPQALTSGGTRAPDVGIFVDQAALLPSRPRRAARSAPATSSASTYSAYRRGAPTSTRTEPSTGHNKARIARQGDAPAARPAAGRAGAADSAPRRPRRGETDRGDADVSRRGQGPSGSGSSRVRFASSPAQLIGLFAELAELGEADGELAAAASGVGRRRGRGLLGQSTATVSRSPSSARLLESPASGRPTAAGESVADETIRALSRKNVRGAPLDRAGDARVQA